MQKLICSVAIGVTAIWAVARWNNDWPTQLQWLTPIHSSGEITRLHIVYDIHLAVMFVMLPTFASMLAAYLLHALSPRVVFLGKGMAWSQAALLGGIIIPLSLLMAVCIDVYGYNYRMVPAFASCFAFPFACAITTFVVLIATRSLKPGLCTSCKYDITHSIDFGRCPECRTAIMQSA